MPELVKEQALGIFLQGKLRNFVKWVLSEIPKTQLPVGYSLNKLATQAQCVEFAEVVIEMREPVTLRDFDALSRHSHATDTMCTVIKAVCGRPELHEKFWRYMDMCVEVVGQEGDE
jgi:hypothetical protein